MKIHYKQSIKEQLDLAISGHAIDGQEIDFIELSMQEYIQFLEELGPTTDRILLNIPGQPRMYRRAVIKVLSA